MIEPNGQDISCIESYYWLTFIIITVWDYQLQWDSQSESDNLYFRCNRHNSYPTVRWKFKLTFPVSVSIYQKNILTVSHLQNTNMNAHLYEIDYTKAKTQEFYNIWTLTQKISDISDQLGPDYFLNIVCGFLLHLNWNDLMLASLLMYTIW